MPALEQGQGLLASWKILETFQTSLLTVPDSSAAAGLGSEGRRGWGRTWMN